jgi:ribosome-binding factor A
MNSSSSYRAAKVAEQIQRDVVEILRNMRDTRLSSSLITITRVEVNNDLSVARVYWSLLDKKDVVLITKVLHGARLFIKSMLAKRLTTYSVPDIRFQYDDSSDRTSRIFALLDKINQIH